MKNFKELYSILNPEQVFIKKQLVVEYHSILF